jgi:SH3-like domain-containing protein
LRRSRIAAPDARPQGRAGKVKRDTQPRLLRPLAALLAAAFTCAPLLVSQPAMAQTTIGPETRLPLPRYVSLKTDKVNLREGPSKEHSTRWVFQRAGLPVEIIAEFDNWRRIRDPEGADGWVWHSLLSGRRTAIVAPWDRGIGEPIPMFERPDATSRIVARVEPGVVATVSRCGVDWCRLNLSMDERRQIAGFVSQEKLWGVYPDETLD